MILEGIFMALLFVGIVFSITIDIFKDIRELVKS